MSDTILAKEFRNEHLSVSRLKLYEQCPRAFFYRYIDKGPEEPRGEAAAFGVVLHAALESVYLWIVENEHDGLFPIERLVDFYRQAWQASGIVGVALYQEGLGLLRTYAMSHSPVSHWGILAVEKEFNVELGAGADRYVVNGYIDRVDLIEEGHVAIVDYKSNRLLFYNDDLENDLQMSVYGLVARDFWPWAKRVSFVFHMLRHDLHQGTERTAEALDDAAGYVVALGKRTEEAKQTWAPRLNPNCGYCDARRRCDLYQRAIAGGHEVAKVADPGDFLEVSRTREELAALAKLMYARKSELDALIKARLEREGEFELNGFHYRMINQNRTTYELPSVERMFGEVGVPAEEVRRRVLHVDKDAVETLAKECGEKLGKVKGQILKTSLDAVAIKTPMSPKLDSHAVKTAKKVRDADVAKEATEAEKKSAKKRAAKETSP